MLRVSASGASHALAVPPITIGPQPAGTTILPRGTLKLVDPSQGTVAEGLYEVIITVSLSASSPITQVIVLMTVYHDEIPIVPDRPYVVGAPGTLQLRFYRWLANGHGTDQEMKLGSSLPAGAVIGPSVVLGRTPVFR